jgi:outer membrane protein OmpA-like peptidoglycan-associated protein
MKAGALLLLLPLLGLSACSQVPVMRGEIEGLEKLVRQAERNGAKRCAPRELALAQSHTGFATVELNQANMFRAEDHLIIARANAQAAYDLSPPSKCSDRGFIMEPVPPPPAEDPDTDGDGLTDSKDACELLPEDKDSYLDSDGCPDVDNDLDGVVDVKDGADRKCQNDPEDPDGYEDDDGCPEPDNDKDAVVDLEDHCPNIPGVNEPPRPGCPKKPALVVVTEKEIKITQQIHFEFNKSAIRPISFPVLDAVVDVLNKNPKIRIEVQGHTDNVGPPAYNKKLSQDRAESVRNYLVSHGVDNSRLVSRGYGMDVPLVPNTDKRNQALNRRVQFVRIEKSGGE